MRALQKRDKTIGADIHFFVEKKSTRLKRQELINNVFNEDENLQMEWESADNWVKNKYFDPEEKDSGERPLTIDRDQRFYSGRNYTLFGVLANVRWRPKSGSISEVKGFPKDASDIVKDEYKSWGGDAHSASYLTLKELLHVDWTKYYKEYEGCEDDLSSFMKTIEKMKMLDDNNENVRCVFWFDN